jgi:hypothetical protein
MSRETINKTMIDLQIIDQLLNGLINYIIIVYDFSVNLYVVLLHFFIIRFFHFFTLTYLNKIRY